MGLKSFRKKRRPGNSKPTGAESERIVRSKLGPCMACLVWFEGKHRAADFIIFGVEYNHVKSGNIRISHAHGYGLCLWHHRCRAQDHTPQQYMDPRMLERVYGPSLAQGSRTFHQTYGSDAELIERQTAWIKEFYGIDTESQDE